MGQRAVVFGAAPTADWRFLSAYLKGDEFVVCADGGRAAAESLGLHPDWYVGDNDSGGWSDRCPASRLPTEKDVTDLDVAVSRALQEGMQEILLCGCAGGREDHHFSAVGQLERIYRRGGRGILLSPNNEVTLLVPGRTSVPREPVYRYFGIVPLDAVLRDVCITGGKYEVAHRDFFRWSSLGVSNELIPGQECCVELREGIGLLIRSNG